MTAFKQLEERSDERRLMFKTQLLSQSKEDLEETF